MSDEQEQRPRRAATPQPSDHADPTPGGGSAVGDTPKRGLGFSDAPADEDHTMLRPDSDATVLRSDLGAPPPPPPPPSAPPTPASTPAPESKPASGHSAWARPSKPEAPATSPDVTVPAPSGLRPNTTSGGPRPDADVDADDHTIDAASLAKAKVTDDPEKNPFAPRPQAEKKSGSFRDHLPFGKKKDAQEGPVGRRVAERKPWFRIPTSDGKKTDKRNVTAALVTGGAIVATLVLLAGFLIWNVNRDPEAMAQSPTPTAELTNEPGPVVSEGSLMTPQVARSITSSDDWNATQTSDQVGEESMGVACVTTTPNGQPVPSGGTFLRTLTSNDTAALHRVDGFANVDEAKSYFRFRSTELGGCQGSPLYVEKGYKIDGLGDEAVAVRLVLQNQDDEYHTVVLARTGQNINIVDVAQPKKAADINKVVDATRQVINRQCGAAAGLCSSADLSIADALPPAGGDEPGFLAAGDIPRITSGTGQWAGTGLTNEVNIGEGSNCEAVDFATVDGADERQQRTYLLRNDPGAPAEFGIDEVVLTMASASDAEKLVKKVGDSIDGCKQRLLTAQVSQKGDVKAKGAGDMEVSGRWFTVTQEVGGGQKSIYRVAIVQSGNKVIYTRMNPTKDFDLDDDAWKAVNERAGQRATQTG